MTSALSLADRLHLSEQSVDTSASELSGLFLADSMPRLGCMLQLVQWPCCQRATCFAVVGMLASVAYCRMDSAYQRVSPDNERVVPLHHERRDNVSARPTICLIECKHYAGVCHLLNVAMRFVQRHAAAEDGTQRPSAHVHVVVLSVPVSSTCHAIVIRTGACS